MEVRHPRAEAMFAWQYSGFRGPWVAQGLAGWHFLSSWVPGPFLPCPAFDCCRDPKAGGLPKALHLPQQHRGLGQSQSGGYRLPSKTAGVSEPQQAAPGPLRPGIIYRAGAGSGINWGSRGLYTPVFWSGHEHLAFSLSVPKLTLFSPPKGPFLPPRLISSAPSSLC